MSIVFNCVSKRYGKLLALDNVSLTIEEGKIYGLLGRNGAGKTTLLNILAGRIFPAAGSIIIDGEMAQENDRALGKIYMSGAANLYPDGVKIKQIFKWTKEFYPDYDMDYALSLSDRFSLNINKKTGTLSTGYDTITKLINALSVNTPYVIFDEPVLGLDVNHRDLFYRTLIEKYSTEPFCAIIATHLINEISEIIEELAVIDKGKIICARSRESLLDEGYSLTGSGQTVDDFTAGLNVIGSDTLGGMKIVYILGKKPKDIPQGLDISPLDLQQLFIQMTGEERK